MSTTYDSTSVNAALDLLTKRAGLDVDTRVWANAIACSLSRLREVEAENVKLWRAVETGDGYTACPLTAHEVERQRLMEAFVAAYRAERKAWNRRHTARLKTPERSAIDHAYYAALDAREAAWEALEAHLDKEQGE